MKGGGCGCSSPVATLLRGGYYNTRSIRKLRRDKKRKTRSTRRKTRRITK